MRLSRYATTSIILAAVITNFSYWLYDDGVLSLVSPGMIMEFTANALLLFIPSQDDYYALPSGVDFLFNFCFYASLIFMTFFFGAVIRGHRETKR